MGEEFVGSRRWACTRQGRAISMLWLGWSQSFEHALAHRPDMLRRCAHERWKHSSEPIW